MAKQENRSPGEDTKFIWERRQLIVQSVTPILQLLVSITAVILLFLYVQTPSRVVGETAECREQISWFTDVQLNNNLTNEQKTQLFKGFPYICDSAKSAAQIFLAEQEFPPKIYEIKNILDKIDTQIAKATNAININNSCDKKGLIEIELLTEKLSQSVIDARLKRDEVTQSILSYNIENRSDAVEVFLNSQMGDISKRISTIDRSVNLIGKIAEQLKFLCG